MINKLFTFYPGITYDPFSVTARISKNKVQLCKKRAQDLLFKLKKPFDTTHIINQKDSNHLTFYHDCHRIGVRSSSRKQN